MEFNSTLGYDYGPDYPAIIVTGRAVPYASRELSYSWRGDPTKPICVRFTWLEEYRQGNSGPPQFIRSLRIRGSFLELDQ